MENKDLENWNEERYKELNTYFRIKIELLLRTNPHLKDQMQQGHNLKLNDLVMQLSEEDKQRWEEFIVLDKIKLEVDMWNHLNGTGPGYQPGIGFINPEDTTW
ncbi:hypothetical protein ACFSKU_16390 [Pontibacter silvestris]|uniref:Uncharacterized protein n=1 Tax=Pontibacter silvestris TaxID=2305183 RepID=A0ABW4X1J0_9BACT|nr:hypothetical protein [Pontibacter silvestris]MCC9136051.1 hypothetical protein [Pontibacter silvestris]